MRRIHSQQIPATDNVPHKNVITAIIVIIELLRPPLLIVVGDLAMLVLV
jgi:hypothetical protein